MSRCSSLSKCCAGKRRKFVAYVRNTKYNLYADLTVRVFAASNDLPELVLSDSSVAFWASVGAAVSFDFYLD